MYGCIPLDHSELDIFAGCYISYSFHIIDTKVSGMVFTQ